jgi:hypothetical protein
MIVLKKKKTNGHGLTLDYTDFRKFFLDLTTTKYGMSGWGSVPISENLWLKYKRGQNERIDD